MHCSVSFKNFLLVLLLSCLISCKKEVTTKIKEAPPFATAGTNQADIGDFQVQLNADSLNEGQSGKWTIVKGLVEEKVYFENDKMPITRFNGMPGETYELKWTVHRGGQLFSESTVKISFRALKAIATTNRETGGTRFNLTGNRLDNGKWTISGKYASISSLQNGGISIPEINSGAIRFQGYSNRKYSITWTTYYGSKSADTTININTGDYLESEALEILGVPGKNVEYEDGHVTKLNLKASGITWVFEDTIANPALQALTYLKYLDLEGADLSTFPVLFGSKYKQLEYLNIEGTDISSLPDNIGQLTKLKHFHINSLNHGARLTSLPESFGNLESLEYFAATGIGLESIPESFSKLKNLKYFEAYLNPLKKLPTKLGDLKNLELLMVSTDENIPASVAKLTKLKRLYFVTTAEDAKLPADFGNMTALDTLEIIGPFRELPNSFGNMNMSIVKFSTPKLASLPANFGNLKRLQTLQIGGLFKTFPDSFTKLSNLENLTTGGAIEYFPEDFGNLKKLGYLDCEFSNLKELPDSFGELDNLTELNLYMSKVAYLPPGFFNLKKIEKINLGYNKLKSLPEAFGKLKDTLRTLYLWGNEYPTSDRDRIKSWLPFTGVYQT